MNCFGAREITLRAPLPLVFGAWGAGHRATGSLQEGAEVDLPLAAPAAAAQLGVQGLGFRV